MLSAAVPADLRDQPPARSPLADAREVAKWIRASALEREGGRAWPGDALEPESVDVDLGAGTAGVLLFFIQMHRHDPQGAYLEEIRAGADYLVATARASIDPATPGEWTTGLYGPIAGPAFALSEAFRVTGDERHRRAALGLVDLLHRAAERDAAGAAWGQSHDVLTGAAGTGLFLLYAAREMGHEPSRALAAEAGRRLLVRGIPDAAGGLTWKGSYEARFVLPNFSHGTAGIGYFLAALHEATGEREFLDGALAAAAWLIRVADRSDGGFRLFYGWPDPGWARRFDIGWAHGPAGTARLFHKLWTITGDAKWRDLFRACAVSLRASGLPSQPRPEYGATFELNQRFGIASVAQFFLDAYLLSRHPDDLSFGRRLSSTILEAAERTPSGLRWPSKRPGFMPGAGKDALFSSYFYGASGYGLLLLKLDAAEQGRPWELRLPDDPFGERPSSPAGRIPGRYRLLRKSFQTPSQPSLVHFICRAATL